MVFFKPLYHFKRSAKLFLRINLGEELKPLDVNTEVVRLQRVGNVYRYGLRYTKLTLIEKFKFRSYLRKWIKKQESPARRGTTNDT